MYEHRRYEFLTSLVSSSNGSIVSSKLPMLLGDPWAPAVALGLTWLRLVKLGGGAFAVAFVPNDGGVVPVVESCRGRFGLRCIADVPGGGNWHRSARPEALQRSHGGASLWMQRCLALRHRVHATGFLMDGREASAKLQLGPARGLRASNAGHRGPVGWWHPWIDPPPHCYGAMPDSCFSPTFNGPSPHVVTYTRIEDLAAKARHLPHD